MRPDYVEELDLISIRTFHKLSAYRSQCIAAALREVNAWYDFRTTEQLKPSKHCNQCSKVERGGYKVRASWAIYMEKLGRSLEQTPDAMNARSSSLLQPVIESARNCHTCLKDIHYTAEMVSSSLEESVKKAIDKVCACYETPFGHLGPHP